uniref:Uncharacterized protein n=1 Tax=Lepeophtheirus salmonis TaxID=72036 RepID=A0A0K2V3C8_LEPSM
MTDTTLFRAQDYSPFQFTFGPVQYLLQVLQLIKFRLSCRHSTLFLLF